MIEFFRVTLYQPLYNLFIFLAIFMPNHNIGLAIIVLTVLIRFLLTPLKYKSIESQLHQRELQPELKRIQEKYKGDKQGQSLAMMQMYKDKGVNPASGCLTQLIQLPILFVLFYVFRDGLNEEHYNLLYSFVPKPESLDRSFLWVKDITQADATFLLPLFAGIAQFFYSRKLMAQMPSMGGDNDTAAIMTKQFTYLFPVMTVLIGRSLPAGLSLYWTAATLVDWWQQTHGTKRFERKQGTKVTVSIREKKESK